jgi:transcription initiation factor TFIIE subunit alpha
MQVNLLRNLALAIAGESASKMVDFIHDKKNVNEFLIAKKLKLTINQTRNILYKLADEGIVSFVRKKDKKKGGWYTYFWTLNAGKGLFKLKERILSDIEKLKNQINSKKTERFYYCANCTIESNEETALLYQYTCPECGEVLQLKEKGKEIENLEKEVARLEELLKGVEIEVGIVTKKEGVVKARKMRAEAKKKAKERAIKKRKKELELKKLKKVKGKAKKGKKKFKKGKKVHGKKFVKLGKKLKKFFRR